MHKFLEKKIGKNLKFTHYKLKNLEYNSTVNILSLLERYNMKKVLLASLLAFSGLFGIEELKKACDSQDWEACVKLGVAYYKGDGVDEDHEEAHTLYEWACDKGHNLDGCFRAGSFYFLGHGTEHNHDKAVLYLKKACDGGHEKGCKMYDRALHEE